MSRCAAIECDSSEARNGTDKGKRKGQLSDHARSLPSGLHCMGDAARRPMRPPVLLLIATSNQHQADEMPMVSTETFNGDSGCLLQAP